MALKYFRSPVIGNVGCDFNGLPVSNVVIPASDEDEPVPQNDVAQPPHSTSETFLKLARFSSFNVANLEASSDHSHIPPSYGEMWECSNEGSKFATASTHSRLRTSTNTSHSDDDVLH